MTTFKVGDRVRLKDNEKPYAAAHELLGTLTINSLKEDSIGTIAYFEGQPARKGTLTERLEHLPAPALIDPAKKYVTRDGREVRIYATDGSKGEEIHGAIKEGDEWESEAWRADGHYFDDDAESCADLVEVKPEREGWINVYDAPHSKLNLAPMDAYLGTSVFPSKEAADSYASSNRKRIACLKITYRDGDGLEGK